MDVLDIFEAASKEVVSFKNHPAKDLALEERLLYLQGIALLMNADSEINPCETDYLLKLMRSLDIEKTCLDTFIEFAKVPDKETLKEFIATFNEHTVANTFIADAWMMIYSDQQVHERETVLLEKMGRQIGVAKDMQMAILAVVSCLCAQNIPEHLLHAYLQLDAADGFQYLLDHYDYALDDLMDDIELKRSEKLENVIRNATVHFLHDLEWQSVEADDEDEAEITDGFLPEINIHDVLTHELLLPFLQAMLDRGELIVAQDQVYKKKGNKEYEYFDTNDLCIVFDETRNLFCMDEGKNLDEEYSLPFVVIEDFLSAISYENIDITNHASINLGLDALFGGHLPDFTDKADEIIFSDNGFYQCQKGRGKIPTLQPIIDMDIIELLASGCIRLIRNNEQPKNNAKKPTKKRK